MFNTRESRQRFYNSKQWKEIRNEVLNGEPLCVHCLKEDIIKPARDVDHIKSLTTNPELCLTLSNLQPLCKMHHDLKTKEETTYYKKWKQYNNKWNI